MYIVRLFGNVGPGLEPLVNIAKGVYILYLFGKVGPGLEPLGNTAKGVYIQFIRLSKNVNA